MKKTLYEGIFILRHGLAPDEMTRAREEVEHLISDGKGKVLERRDMGKRLFSYPIQKRTEGHYAVLDFELEPSHMASFTRSLQLNSKILRHMVTRKGAEVVKAPPNRARKDTKWRI